MNLYFWLFVLYALLITPVGAHVYVQIDHGFHYRVRLRAAGLPVLYKRDGEAKTNGTRRSRLPLDPALAVHLLRGGHIQRALKVLEWRGLQVDAHLSFENAAVTALACAALRTVVQTAARCRPQSVRSRITADFSGRGSKIAVHCIVSARLGSLSAAAIRLWLAAGSARAKQWMAEEENYAAASH